MQVQFIKNSNKCGNHIFELIRKEGNVYLYKRTVIKTGKVFGYEVIISTVVKAGTIFTKGGKPTAFDYESYPGFKAFGRKGWFCATLDQATQRFDEIITGKLKIEEGNEDENDEDLDEESETVPVVQPTVTKKVKTVIPATEFNQDQFLTVNDGMDTKTVEKVLKVLLVKGFIKETNHKGYYVSVKK